MPTTSNFKNVIQYTILAATTAKNIAETAKVPFLGSTAVLCLSISKSIETTKLNKEECVEIMEHIHEILCIIIQLHSTSEIKGVLPAALLYDIAKFTEALEKLFTILNVQHKGTLGKIKGLFRQPKAAERLETCKQELSRMVELFKAQVTVSTLAQMGQMKKDAKEQHEQLVALLETHSDFSGSDCSSVTGTLSRLGNNSSVSFVLLPPCPKIFHGREVELQDVVNILVQASARIAILGAGGMGKTSLATAALHNTQIEANELAATIADHIGLEKGSSMARKIAHYFTHAPPSLLVLDNLDTPWETISSRSEVEEFLSLLTDVLHLGLMGAERPSKSPMDQAFLGPLKPLSNMAAWQTFIEVADEGHDDASIKELLELTGNLPLAVSLIANVLGLKEGYDQRSSLDISIMLSYTSSRMTPGAQELLSILSMLPDGLADSDLVQAKLPIIDILACKATLIRTSLAFVDQDQHLKVLVPIREHILYIHPPTNALKLKLREHFHQIINLWNQFKDINDGLETGGPDIVQNFRSILQWYCALGHYFRLTKLNIVEALKHYQGAYSLAESIGYPTIVGHRALVWICYILMATGKPLSALTHATEAYRYAEHLGSIYGQARSLHYLAIAHLMLANYWHSQCLSQRSRDLLTACGFQQSILQLHHLNVQAEIHLLKSEYLESRIIQAVIASSRQPASSHAIMANLHIAIIDIATGADSQIIHQNLDLCRFNLKPLYGHEARQLSLTADLVDAQLCLRDGVVETSNTMFKKCFASSLHMMRTDLALQCAERLADLSTGMNDITTTLQWGGLFISLALKCKDKRQTMQAFRCLGQIFLAEGDNETALSLFNAAFDGFTFMDVHRWGQIAWCELLIY
ncbi:hypothetical protein C8J57DRAFT_1672697, partial [Mycena rebaudengoi]